MNRFRGGLVFKAHRLVYHPTLGSRVIKKKKISNVISFDDVAACLEVEREFFIDNLLVRIRFTIVMIRWTGLAPWESRGMPRVFRAKRGQLTKF